MHPQARGWRPRASGTRASLPRARKEIRLVLSWGNTGKFGSYTPSSSITWRSIRSLQHALTAS
eukprot:14370714-Heterocapsa_arctica.AAC.1